MNNYNPNRNRNKAEKKVKIIKKLSYELTGTFIIMLILMLFKYPNTNVTKKMNDKAKTIFYSDYTSKTTQVFSNIPPYLNKLLNKQTGSENKDTSSSNFSIEFLPVEDIITDTFGQRVNPITKKNEIHTGVDINAKVGTPVKAVLDGTVENVEESEELGLVVTIAHENGYKTKYAHLSVSKVSKNEKVTKGQIIALSGNTGNSTGPHLHFEIIKDGKALNPLDYLTTFQKGSSPSSLGAQL